MKKSLRPILAVAAVFAIAAAGYLSADDKPLNPSNPDGRPHYRAKQIIGAKVQIQGDSQVGTVDDIVLDDFGNVDYLIVVNSENQLVTVPWDATAFNVEKRVAVVHITPEKYRAVPTYSVQQYPVFSTPAYRTQVYKYYGLTPGEQRRAIRRGAVLAP